MLSEQLQKSLEDLEEMASMYDYDLFCNLKDIAKFSPFGKMDRKALLREIKLDNEIKYYIPKTKHGYVVLENAYKCWQLAYNEKESDIIDICKYLIERYEQNYWLEEDGFANHLGVLSYHANYYHQTLLKMLREIFFSTHKRINRLYLKRLIATVGTLTFSPNNTTNPVINMFLEATMRLYGIVKHSKFPHQDTLMIDFVQFLLNAFKHNDNSIVLVHSTMQENLTEAEIIRKEFLRLS
jgi:hypothetical protein